MYRFSWLSSSIGSDRLRKRIQVHFSVAWDSKNAGADIWELPALLLKLLARNTHPRSHLWMTATFRSGGVRHEEAATSVIFSYSYTDHTDCRGTLITSKCVRLCSSPFDQSQLISRDERTQKIPLQPDTAHLHCCCTCHCGNPEELQTGLNVAGAYHWGSHDFWLVLLRLFYKYYDVMRLIESYFTRCHFKTLDYSSQWGLCL